MKSMTGYGRAVESIENSTLTIQVNSVNRKTLDMSLSMPSAWEDLERAVRDAVRGSVARGKVHVRIELTSEGGNSAVTWDESAVKDTLCRLQSTAEEQGIAFEPTPELVWQVANAHRQNGGNIDAEAARETVVKTLAEALVSFVKMRSTEGAALLEDLEARLKILQELAEKIAVRAPEVAPAHRDTLLKRLREGDLDLDLNDERVLKEIAFFADRCDITEEITRLRSHFDQFGKLVHGDHEIGRKAEFLLQEIGREVNTIGSKANDLTIARQVIEMKNELDRVREQIANVE